MRCFLKKINRFLPVLRVTGAFLLLLLCNSGCADRDDALQDAAERSEPLMRKAASRERARDLDGAIKIYERVVYELPSVAMAHLKLGILLDDYRKDYVGAVYHYRTYLRWRESAEKADMVKSLLQEAERKLETEYAAMPGGRNEEQAALETRIT